MFDSADQIQNRREHHTQQNRSSKRKVKRGVLAVIENIAWQAADGKIGATDQNQKQSEGDEDDAKEQEHLADFDHDSILEEKFAKGGSAGEGARPTRKNYFFSVIALSVAVVFPYL